MTDRFPQETAVPTELEHDLTELLRARATEAVVDPDAAFAEHGRRLRASNTRRMSTLAAAVVALIGGATLAFVPRPAPTQSVATPPLRITHTSTPATPQYPTFRIADFTAKGATWVAWAVIKDDCLDIIGFRAGQPADPNNHHQYPGGSIDCPLTVQDPSEPMILMSGILSASDEVNTSPLPDLSLWVTQSEVARLDITLADKQTVPTRLLGTVGNLKLFLCEHNVGYYRADTYYDASGKQIYRDTTPFDK